MYIFKDQDICAAGDGNEHNKCLCKICIHNRVQILEKIWYDRYSCINKDYIRVRVIYVTNCITAS